VSAAIAEAIQDMERAQAERLARTAAERSRRHLLRLLDWAIAVCEEINLGHRPAQDLAMAGVAALIEQLEAIGGGQPAPVASTGDALERLFTLQEGYLLNAREPDDELARAMEQARWNGPPELEAQAERIAGAAGVSLQVLRGPSRRRELVAVRRLVAHHLQSRGCSLPAIGRMLNRDSSSVVNLLRPGPGAGQPAAARSR
jgi:hypothetical protein